MTDTRDYDYWAGRFAGCLDCLLGDVFGGLISEPIARGHAASALEEFREWQADRARALGEFVDQESALSDLEDQRRNEAAAS